MLGLAHPDAGAEIGENYIYDRSDRSSDPFGSGSDQLVVNCTHPTARVQYHSNTSAIEDTIMRVFTFNNPSTCIFQVS